jgi:hypothetical protein
MQIAIFRRWRAFMVLQLFEAGFLVALAGLVLSVPVGLLVLAWPRRTPATRLETRHGAAAHA